MAPIRFGPGTGGTTAISTSAQLDGPFPDGRVQALRVPIQGRIGRGGSFAFGTSCAVVSWNYLQLSALQLGAARLPVCPAGSAIISKSPGGGVQANARVNATVLNGRLGSSPLRVSSTGGRLTGESFAFNQVGLRLGRSESPIVFDASRLTGSFAGGGTGGKFSGARATIGSVPLLLSEASGDWRVRNGGLLVTGGMMVSDRAEDPPRFYPLRSDNVKLTVGGDYVRATGALRHPASGTLVTDVSIEHRLSTGVGHANLDVPGLQFGPELQPQELTHLTEGILALVMGTVSGQGRIDWAGQKVTSTGDFSIANMDLAAPFGPVTGLSTNIHFTDLLAMATAPGQTATIASVNPGILVENGVIRYQILPNQLVKIERGEWPFMLPKIQSTVEAREQKIAEDLERAKSARAEAEETEAAWRARMDAARAEAAKLAQDARQESSRDTEAQVRGAADKISLKVEAAAKQIREAVTSARKEIETVAADATQDMVARLTGITVNEKEAAAAVKAELNV